MSVKKDSGLMGIKNESGTQRTYFFQQPPNMLSKEATFKGKLWQIIPSISVLGFCISFGIMLGWPSPTYPLLLDEEISPVPITMVQSPLIAGFLMFGNIFSTPFSDWTFCGRKYAILISIIIMTCGWTLIWQSQNLYYLMISRFLVGMGNGYGLGHVKGYIKETCSDLISGYFIKGINVAIAFGVLFAYCVGSFTDFRSFQLIILFIVIVIFFICFFLPLTPNDYISFKNIKSAKKRLRVLKPGVNLEEEISQLRKNEEAEKISLGNIFSSNLRKPMFTLSIITFSQQFSGAPATIVYSQFLFAQLRVPHPEYCAILYGVLFLVSTIVGMFYITQFNKKYSLLYSSLSVLLVLIFIILVIHFKINDLWEYALLVLMSIYIVVHTVGLGTVPFSLIDYLFPKNSRVSVAQFHMILYCACAVVITKLFQVFYSADLLIFIFCLFACSSLVACLIVSLMLPKRSPL